MDALDDVEKTFTPIISQLNKGYALFAFENLYLNDRVKVFDLWNNYSPVGVLKGILSLGVNSKAGNAFSGNDLVLRNYAEINGYYGYMNNIEIGIFEQFNQFCLEFFRIEACYII